MKCFEVKGCSDECREACFVYRNFRNNTADMENLSCWILKKGTGSLCSDKPLNCSTCPYYIKMNKNAITVNLGEYDSVIIECFGTLNTLRCDALGKVAARLKKVKKSRVIIDVSNVNNIYSCALGMIIKFHQQCDQMGGKLVLVGATGYVKIALATARLDRFIMLVDTMKEALRVMVQLVAKETIVDDETSETDIELLRCEDFNDDDDDGGDVELHETKIITLL